MTEKFNIDELLIRVMPGGFFIGVLYFLFSDDIQIEFMDGLDFFYTFIFFCSAFIAGELLQTFAREMEWAIDIFFKFRRPSQVFLYKGNPVLRSKRKRQELLALLDLSESELRIFKKDYSKLPFLFGRNSDHDDLSQSIFWQLYSEVSEQEEVRISNRNYLFTRVITFVFLILGIIFFLDDSITLGCLSLLLSVLFLWRSRGIARGLVFKAVLLNLKKH